MKVCTYTCDICETVVDTTYNVNVDISVFNRDHSRLNTFKQYNLDLCEICIGDVKLPSPQNISTCENKKSWIKKIKEWVK